MLAAAPRTTPNIVMIGLTAAEEPWVRLLVTLLRAPDPNTAELARQALLYLENTAARAAPATR